MRVSKLWHENFWAKCIRSDSCYVHVHRNTYRAENLLKGYLDSCSTVAPLAFSCSCPLRRLLILQLILSRVTSLESSFARRIVTVSKTDVLHSRIHCCRPFASSKQSTLCLTSDVRPARNFAPCLAALGASNPGTPWTLCSKRQGQGHPSTVLILIALFEVLLPQYQACQHTQISAPLLCSLVTWRLSLLPSSTSHLKARLGALAKQMT